MRLRALLIPVVIAAAALPAVAGAAVTVGSPLVASATSNAPPGTCMTGPCTYIQTDGSAVPVAQYVVPDNIASGVITSWSFKASSGDNALQVLRPQGSGIFTDVGHTTGVLGAGASTIATAATRLPVQAGDSIGLFNDSNALVMNTNATLPSSSVVRAFDPAVASVPAIASASAAHSELELQATIEPDADADGFGDETQDQCPSDPQRQTACSSDLQVSVSSTTPSKLKAGQIASYTVTVHNAGSSPAANATVGLALPVGVSPGSLASTVGSCGAGSCLLGTLAKGATATISFSIATTKPGTITVSAAAASTIADPNPADDNDSVTTTVEPADLKLADLAVFPKSFHRGRGLPYLSGRAKARPCAIKFSLSEAATVRLSFQLLAAHAPARGSQSFSIAAREGDNRLIFFGVMPDHRALKVGTYRLTASAVTSDGRRAHAAAVRFTVLPAG